MTSEQTSHLASLKKAAASLSRLAPQRKSQTLERLAELIESRRDQILSQNEKDLFELAGGHTQAFVDRLTLNPERLNLMAESLRQVAGLADPVGEIDSVRTLANGLELRRVRAPLGVIFMIFEARPNVITEAFSLAFKAGNAIILRGGKESRHTASFIYNLIQEALSSQQIASDCLWGITDPDRSLVLELLKSPRFIDVVVPRGGEALIDMVVRESRIPIIKNDRGMCHLYVHRDAELEMALAIASNAKSQRPGVCNSLETVLVHEDQAELFIPALYQKLKPHNTIWYACKQSLRHLPSGPEVKSAASENWDTEYLDHKINCRTVESFSQALEHIERHGSRHSEMIVCRDVELAEQFQAQVDAAAVYWNASSRFTDGFEFGLGGELGISTQKLHVRGPVGLRELTSLRWVIKGSGQIRES